MLRRYSSPAGSGDDARCTPRPPLSRFHTTLPDLCHKSPALYRHSIVSLPSPSPSGPESPANASEALKDILERQSHPQPPSHRQGVKVANDGSGEDDGDAKGVERRKWYPNRPLHLQEPPRVRASRSITLPLPYPRISQPQPQPIRVTQTAHRPDPPFTSPLSSHERPDGNGKEKDKREKFDVDKVYARLRVAEGRVSFDDLGLGLCAEEMDREGDVGQGENTEGDKPV
ncbi:hypothetical protein I314_04223 [Cryptococcus bacillisporus CA1873]|uniref:Uncharacterized protein n=1 Tax=Cryptococcus bacillisporus CA1873 TaxID=1296111 RepID=A0ABR5B8A3_CRYGA|nr:hypothetical protein I314_04223 [Cryptococcus bacillisporus CA1873]|eukprot:KIR59790.1 hypothetical protein I314_04223 [Cryptococcus gattii CA1873]